MVARGADARGLLARDAASFRVAARVTAKEGAAVGGCRCGETARRGRVNAGTDCEDRRGDPAPFPICGGVMIRRPGPSD